MRILTALVYTLLLSSFAQAYAQSEAPPFSPALGELIHPVADQAGLHSDRWSLAKSDLSSMLKYVSDVKNQGSRNTCTIFTMTALLETLYLKKYPAAGDIDLSEEWLQYIMALQSPSGGANGSTIRTNFKRAQESGMALEAHMAYDGSIWTANSSHARAVCGHLSGLSHTRCLMGHRDPSLLALSDAELLNQSGAYYDPEFVEARNSAREIRKSLIQGRAASVITSSSQIKSLLNQGIPLAMEINIFYESWNHSFARALGMAPDAGLYAKGIVTHPEVGSLDRQVSPTEPARHAVLVLGYDDDVSVTYTRTMNDGSSKTFTRKGVYYFKNSWGTRELGREFKFNGSRIPGFGMILQDHAHEHGQFTSVR